MDLDPPGHNTSKPRTIRRYTFRKRGEIPSDVLPPACGGGKTRPAWAETKRGSSVGRGRKPRKHEASVVVVEEKQTHKRRIGDVSSEDGSGMDEVPDVVSDSVEDTTDRAKGTRSPRKRVRREGTCRGGQTDSSKSTGVCDDSIREEDGDETLDTSERVGNDETGQRHTYGLRMRRKTLPIASVPVRKRAEQTKTQSISKKITTADMNDKDAEIRRAALKNRKTIWWGRTVRKAGTQSMDKTSTEGGADDEVTETRHASLKKPVRVCIPLGRTAQNVPAKAITESTSKMDTTEDTDDEDTDTRHASLKKPVRTSISWGKIDRKLNSAEQASAQSISKVNGEKEFGDEDADNHHAPPKKPNRKSISWGKTPSSPPVDSPKISSTSSTPKSCSTQSSGNTTETDECGADEALNVPVVTRMKVGRPAGGRVKQTLPKPRHSYGLRRRSRLSSGDCASAGAEVQVTVDIHGPVDQLGEGCRNKDAEMADPDLGVSVRDTPATTIATTTTECGEKHVEMAVESLGASGSSANGSPVTPITTTPTIKERNTQTPRQTRKALPELPLPPATKITSPPPPPP
ncbi:hypothetical protein HK102_008578, partial [Quaeritorhiza haematococci]